MDQEWTFFMIKWVFHFHMTIFRRRFSPLNICLFTVKNEKGRTMCKICSKLKKPERRQLYVPKKLFFSHRCIENNFINGKPIRAYRHVQYLPSLETLLMIQKTMTEKTYAVNYRCCMYKKKEYCQI